MADPTPQASFRGAFSGRKHEFGGIALVALGVIVVLGVYLEIAGPFGRAMTSGLGWLTGIGRFLIPVALIGLGLSLIKQGYDARRTRLVIGWILVSAAAVGLAHIGRGPQGWGNKAERLDGGGAIGSVLGAPLEALLSPAGGTVLLIAVLLVGLLLVTGKTAREFFSLILSRTRKVAVPVGHAAKRKWDDLSTLNSEREGDDDWSDEDWGDDLSDDGLARRRSGFDDEFFDDEFFSDGDEGATHLAPGPPATIYDGERDLPVPVAPEPDRREPARKPPRRTEPVFDDLAPGEQGHLDLGPAAEPGKWKLPSLASLGRSTNQAINMVEVEARGRVLEESLAAHGVEVRLVGQTVGPTVTRYELELGAGVKVARVTTLQKDIAYALAAVDVRILAPIPGRSAIGIEVPNHTRQLVMLGDLFASAESKAASHPLDVAIGKDIAGRAVFLNLSTTPHLLVAGATGAGKSSGINCILTSILMRTTPDQVRLILIDPKQVEMGQYNNSPHLLTAPVTNPKKAANALAWAVKEMERRYDLLFEVGYRDIGGYNSAYDRGELKPQPGQEFAYDRLPYIVVVVDELNDLMMVAARDVEDSITRIAQKARAVGIHLIVATQRPSANVITGVIKANIPARMAFAVSSQTDSRVILDQNGAEKLVGKGDMLLLPGNSSVAARIQGAFVTEEEIRKVVAHWKRQAPSVTYVTGVEGDEDGPAGGFGGGPGSYGADDDEDETLLRQAMDLVVRSQLGSTSMLQRKLKIGFARAGRIMDLLEQRGVVGPSEGSKARSVLMTVTELELIQEQDRGGR